MMQCLKKFFYVVQNKSQYYNRINSIHKYRECAILNFGLRFKHDSNVELEEYEETPEEKITYTQLSNNYFGVAIDEHKVFVIQPYIKWGVNKNFKTTPQLKLDEAVALINTLGWSVVNKTIVPLLTFQKNKLFGSGALETLRKNVRNCPNVTAIFVNINSLQYVQIIELQKAFNLPIYDRYSIIIHIFRKHAKTGEAKLQVALAEIPYLTKKLFQAFKRIGRINLDERTKEFLEVRGKKLRNAIEKLRKHRKMTKNQRLSFGFPSVAVVGYTNAGKTSLIKALTGSVSLKPKNQLFATLDTTIHEGVLPNRLKILYVDTIGFIQDVPKSLLEPFAVTLEDAMSADIIIHVYDMSHPDVKAQIQHVQEVIQPMVDKNKLIINVANKCDIVEQDISKRESLPEDTLSVSAVKLIGIESLQLKIQSEIIDAANLISKCFRVRAGSNASSWLYKETTVTNAEPDLEDPQYLLLDVIMSTSTFYKFKRFCKLEKAHNL